MKEPQPDITQFIGALKRTIQMLQNTVNETSVIWSPVATKLDIGNSVSKVTKVGGLRLTLVTKVIKV